MEKTFTTFGKQLLFGCIGLISGVFMATGVQYVLAWTGPTAAPPNNNVAAPINVSATAQTKAGTLGVTRLYDDDTNYYIDANTTSNIVSTNLHGAIYDGQNTGYYVDPSGTNRLNYGDFDNVHTYGNVSAGNVMYSQQYIDSNNGGYYVDPNNGSRMNYIAADNMHAYGNIGTGGYIDTHDVWLRSVGKWASTVANEPSCNWGGQVGVICGGRSEYWSVFYTCTNGKVTNISLVWTGC